MADQIYPDPIPGIMPFGTITIFTGAPSVGKTAMLADWIQRWRTHRPIWGHQTNAPTQFAYIAGDRRWSTSHQHWFNRVGFPEIPHYSIADDREFKSEELRDPSKALDMLRRCLKFAADGYAPVPGAHVIVDPAIPLFIAGNHNAPRDVAYSLISMSRIAEEMQINLTLVGHFGKQKGENSKDRYTRPQDRIAGSYAFSGYSDTQIFLLEPEGDQMFYTLGMVPRLRAPEFHKCQKNDMGLFVPFDDLIEHKSHADVFECVRTGMVNTIAEIRERGIQMGHSKATVERALKQLVDDRRVAKLGRGRYQRVKVH